MGQKKTGILGFGIISPKILATFRYIPYICRRNVSLTKLYTVMKKLMMILMCMMSMTVFAQDKPPVQVATTMIQNQNAKFQLFPTQNIYVFLKLNTATGEITIVQYGMSRDERVEVKLESEVYPLVQPEDEQPGRFFLYPTTNIYNFIMLDQIDGRIWQVQWDTKPDNRIIFKIGKAGN